MIFRVRIERVILPPNVPAGMNPLQLLHFAYTMRATNEDLEPIVVRALDKGIYGLVDGRHRFIASLIAGRPDVLAVEEP